ncbi:MAG TPA: hypothetical protein VM099_06850 [Gemmatimonadaceae bacterium]|nr:hypothetical protein [Gemmatimonadaceae bacterium]
MREGFGMVVFSFGLVALGFGVTFLILGWLGSHYGTPHERAPMLTIGSLVIGAILVGASRAMSRSSSKQDTTR